MTELCSYFTFIRAFVANWERIRPGTHSQRESGKGHKIAEARTTVRASIGVAGARTTVRASIGVAEARTTVRALRWKKTGLFIRENRKERKEKTRKGRKGSIFSSSRNRNDRIAKLPVLGSPGDATVTLLGSFVDLAFEDRAESRECAQVAGGAEDDAEHRDDERNEMGFAANCRLI